EILPLVNFAGTVRSAGNPIRSIQVFENFLFTAAAVFVDEGTSMRPTTCSFQCKLGAGTSEGTSFGADLRFFGCAVMPADNQIEMFDRRLRFVGSDVINTTVAGFNTGRVE